MKTNHAIPAPSIRPLLLAAASAALLILSACSESKRDELADQTKEAVADSKAALARGWDHVKDFTFEKRSELELQLKAKQADLAAKLSELRADYAEEKASASRKAAMDELRNSERDYQEKLAALGTATADTWDAARHNVAAAWDRLEAAYAKARAD